MRFNISAVALAAASLLGIAQPAVASGLLSMSSAIMVSLEDVESQAQLAKQLQAEGYSNILLAAITATRMNPHPELNPSETNIAGTPVRPGWNGTAVKDGKTYDVYVNFVQ
ncbi:MAG: hypothetical protein P4L52_07955 [Acidocella sp.]|nr:hypothetical protein [Acidocella sp.]MDR3717899.1 hypothetical protein [Bryobacteraceae bacterium]